MQYSYRLLHLLAFVMLFVVPSNAKRIKVYEYSDSLNFSQLILYPATNNEGLFEFQKSYIRKDRNKCGQQDTLFYKGVYTFLSDSTIEMTDLRNMRRIMYDERTIYNWPMHSEDDMEYEKGFIYFNLSVNGVKRTYDFYGVTSENDTIVHENLPWQFRVSSDIEYYFIKLREESSNYGAITFPNHKSSCPKCCYQLVSILCNPTPSIEHDIWKVNRKRIIPLENDYRTYSNNILKRTKKKRITPSGSTLFSE